MTVYGTLQVGDKLDETLNWATWLGADTIASSEWAVDSATGLTLSDDSFATTTTTVWGEVIEPGTYRLTNSIVTTQGRESSDDVVIYVEDAGMGYLAPSEAEARLWGRYKIEAEISVGDVEAASSELDAISLIGGWYSEDQGRAFPRDVTIGDDAEGEVPESILDWVALRAYQFATDEGPSVISEGAGGVSVTYSAPKFSRVERLKRHALAPYRAAVRIV